jgi:hydrogenase-4 component E
MTLLDPIAASRLLDACAAGIVIVGVLIAGTRSIGRAIWLLAVQSVLLAAAALGVGVATGTEHLVAGSALTLGVKGIAVPLILGRILRQSPVRVERHPYLGPRASLVVAVAIVFATATTVDAATLGGPVDAPRALPAAVAEVLTGLLIAMTRRKALSTVVGLLVFENGLALTAFSLTYGMPLVVELGIAFDLLVAIVVVWVYARRMLAVIGSLSTDRLRSLRG